jgi:hypothetical protein
VEQRRSTQPVDVRYGQTGCTWASAVRATTAQARAADSRLRSHDAARHRAREAANWCVGGGRGMQLSAERQIGVSKVRSDVLTCAGCRRDGLPCLWNRHKDCFGTWRPPLASSPLPIPRQPSPTVRNGGTGWHCCAALSRAMTSAVLICYSPTDTVAESWGALVVDASGPRPLPHR